MGDMMKKKSNEKKDRRTSSLPVMNQPCIELSGNREMLIEGCKGVLEYTPACIRVNTASMILTAEGRELNLRCISESALIIDGFMTSLSFTV